ncbi:FtsZ/tubulin family protein [Labilibaculum antarcticum]|uniref:Cell division protein FtsZ C-terminal domain-containing protein n=1 Tax=Labilibaculum antarcticum TaxID=1717717 RepID=A0A1Y1CPG8_9BACT|nr:hypothetical protein [Labilibaculum antarcticum]BAX82349.1 hypothetical protein ALGA_4058 [Labilibaculum antarcticum]
MHTNTFQTCPANIIQAIALVLQNPGYIKIDAEDFAHFTSSKENIQYLILEEKAENLDSSLRKALQTLPSKPTTSEILVCFTSSEPEITMVEIGNYIDQITENFGEKSNIIWGVNKDENLKEDTRKILLLFSPLKK